MLREVRAAHRPRSPAAGRCQHGVAARDGACDADQLEEHRRRVRRGAGRRPRRHGRAAALNLDPVLGPQHRHPDGRRTGRARTRWCSGSPAAAGSARRLRFAAACAAAGVELSLLQRRSGHRHGRRTARRRCGRLDRWARTSRCFAGTPTTSSPAARSPTRRQGCRCPPAPDWASTLDDAGLHRGVERFERDGEYDYYGGPPSAAVLTRLLRRCSGNSSHGIHRDHAARSRPSAITRSERRVQRRRAARRRRDVPRPPTRSGSAR